MVLDRRHVVPHEVVSYLKSSLFLQGKCLLLQLLGDRCTSVLCLSRTLVFLFNDHTLLLHEYFKVHFFFELDVYAPEF